MVPWMLAVLMWLAAFSDTQLVTVGRVIVVGNATVRDDLIRRAVGIAPGDRVNSRGTRLAQKALTRLGVFEVIPEKGIRPTVTLIATDQPGLCDVLIQVREPAPPR